ncbi:hypothetical protein CXB51_001477 [Gossypium anomalum]|uniref:Uncharacterized protein n=1 Tax=Gossypium anomalum TaxID=47600 RepID=A0A8J6DC36_9ROSI|nr:hypothetical protein CXB51_001477 [Gossypium anomalum]
MGFNNYARCTKNEPENSISLFSISFWENIERVLIWGMET